MMNVLKQVLNFYINSSIHVALAVFSLSWITLMEFGIPYDKHVQYFIFYASIAGYNFVKYFGLVKFHYRKLTNWFKLIQVCSFICFALMCYYAYQLKVITLVYIAGFGIITFFYAIPFLPRRLFLDNQHNLRSISGLKVYVIALVWTGVTVFIPLIDNDYDINLDVILTAFQRFIFVIILMLPFEIRDLQFDSLKLSTIPQKIGVKQTKQIGVLLLMLCFFLEFFKNEIRANQITILLIVIFVALFLLLFSRKTRGNYYSSFWVEGLPILWLILMLIFT